MQLDPPAGDGSPMPDAGAAASELRARIEWLLIFAADDSIELPATWAERKQMLEDLVAEEQQAQREWRHRAAKKLRALRKCRMAGFTPRTIEGDMIAADIMKLRAYVRAAAAETAALKVRIATCSSKCKGEKASLASDLKDAMQENHENGQLCLSLQKRVGELEKECGTIQLTLGRADDRNDALSDRLAEALQQKGELESKLLAAESKEAELLSRIEALTSKQASDMQKRLVGAMAKPATFEGRMGQGTEKGHSVRDWIASVKRYVESAEFSDTGSVRFAASFLRGAALRAWNTRHTSCRGPAGNT